MGQSIKKDTAWLMALQIGQTILGFLTGVIIARFLGPADRGALALFTFLVLLLTQVCDLGLNNASIYFLSKHRYSSSTINSNALVWSFSFGLILLTTFFWLNEATLEYLYPSLPSFFLFLAVLITPFSLYTFQWSGIFTGLAQIRQARLFSLVNQIVNFLFTAFSVLVMKWPLVALIYFTVFYNIFSTAIALLLLHRITPLKFSFNWRILISCISYGLPLHLGLILNTFHLRIDVFIVQFFHGNVEVGFYVIAVSLAESLQYLESALINASIFHLANRSMVESKELAGRITRHLGFILGTIALVMSLMSYSFIILAYGSQYKPSILPFNILLPGIIALSLTKPAAVFVAYQFGLSKVNLGAAALGLLLNLILNLLLIPEYGILGAALASTLSYFSVFLFVMGYFVKLSQSSFKQIFIVTYEDIDVYKNLLNALREKQQNLFKSF
jgi:O-antigen/teichoic acid export membrane protein